MRRLAPAALLVAVIFSACGGKNSPTSPTASTPQPYFQTVGGSVDVFGTTRHPLTIPRSGNLTLSLTWSDPVVDLDLYLASSSCSLLYPMSSCGIILSSSAGVGQTREAVARSVNAGDAFSVFVDNLSRSRSQTYTLTISIQ